MSILSLWLPILVSAIAVWIASALVWMVMPWHKKDFAATAEEEAVRAALRGNPPGLYTIPHCVDQKAFKDPAIQKKFEEGPLAYITVTPDGMPSMGGKLLGAFLFYLLVGVCCAYLLTRTGMTESGYLEVFRVSGTVAFLAYGFAYLQESIWFGRSWGLTMRSGLDALIYSLVTGGVFGWLIA